MKNRIIYAALALLAGFFIYTLIFAPDPAVDLVDAEHVGREMFHDYHPVARTMLQKATHAGGAMALFLLAFRVLVWMVTLPKVRRVVFGNKDEVTRINWHLSHKYNVPADFELAPVARIRKPRFKLWLARAFPGTFQAPPPPTPADGSQAQQARPATVQPVEIPAHIADLAGQYAIAEAIKLAGIVGSLIFAGAVAFAFG